MNGETIMEWLETTTAKVKRYIEERLTGQTLNEIQFKTEKNMTPAYIPDIGEGGLEVKFANKDGGTGPVVPQGTFGGNNATGESSEKTRTQGNNKSNGKGTSMPKECALLDCEDLNCTFSIVGVRNGSIHLLSKNDLGTTNTVRVDKVFDVSGRPIVRGIVIRQMWRERGNQNPSYRLRGFIDFNNYIGVSAHAVLPLEDIIQEGVQAARTGSSQVPDDIAVRYG